jgi:hypothetical protein
MKVTTANIVDGAGTILDQILKTRLQRKAKTILMSSIQLIILIVALFLMNYDIELFREDEIIPHRNLKVCLVITIGLAGVYIAILSVFIFIHSVCLLPPNSETTHEIEDAFSRTNSIPYIDGLLELGFPTKYKGNKWYLPYIIWSISGAIVGVTAYIFVQIFDGDHTSANTATHGAAALLFYQITTDFSEYWVHTRMIRPETFGGVSEGDDNDDDEEEEIRREGSSYNLGDRREYNYHEEEEPRGSARPIRAQMF